MPPKQRGHVDRPPSESSWRARWIDEAGTKRIRRGFATRSAGYEFLRVELDRVERLRAGEVVIGPDEIPTMQRLVDEFLAQHSAEANTIATLTHRLKHVTSTFGPIYVNRLAVPSIAIWRKQLPAGSAWHIHKAFRQVLAYAVAAGYVPRNVAKEVSNPEPKRPEIVIFDSPFEVDLVAAQLPDRHRLIPILATETGLRPEEWIPLERRDIEIDRETGTGMLHVRRVYTGGVVKPYGKQKGSLRSVFLTERVCAEIALRPVRIDTQLLIPGDRGGYLDLHAWRSSHWRPAVVAAGMHVDDQGRPLRRTPYSLRHTFAAWMIAGNIDLFTLARRMGTSLQQIENTYGHLRRDSLEREREAFTAWQRGLVKPDSEGSHEEASR